MAVDAKTVKHIAHLARLRVPEDQIDRVAGDLNKILAWVEQLDEVDVTGIEPLTSVNDLSLRLRDDIITDGAKAQEILANAPERTADFFTVPKVVE